MTQWIPDLELVTITDLVKDEALSNQAACPSESSASGRRTLLPSTGIRPLDKACIGARCVDPMIAHVFCRGAALGPSRRLLSY